MPRKMAFEQPESILSENREVISDIEKETGQEEIEKLPDREEPGAFYRGLTVQDALRAIFGKLNLEANPKGEVIGSRDNAFLNLHDAIPFAESSQTKKGEKFLCAIGFIPLPASKIEDSYLKKFTSARITGPVLAREVVLRFAGKKPGQPQKRVLFFSPKRFYEWTKENVG